MRYPAITSEVLDEHVRREELMRRAGQMHALLDDLLDKARQEQLPAFFIERMEQALSLGPSVLGAIDLIRRQPIKPAEEFVRAEDTPEQQIARYLKAGEMVPFWYIQWHLRTSMFDACQECLSRNIHYATRRHRVCLDCDAVYKLRMSITQWRKKVVQPPLPSRRHEQVATCAFAGCDADAVSKGWCQRHYQQWRNNPKTMSPLENPPPRCAAPGCERTEYAKGYCRRHWRQLNDKGGIVLTRHKDLGRVCRVCPEPAQVKGYCPRHWAQMKVHGKILD